METEARVAILAAAGIHGHGMVDALARMSARFTESPTPEAVEAYIARELKAEAPHLFDTPQQAPPADPVQQVLDRLSPSERLARHRAQVPPPAKRRPVPPTLSEQEVRELAALSPVARLVAYRAKQEARP